MAVVAVESKRRTRPPKITRDEIVVAAMRMLKENGQFSMPKLAQQLGVTTMALYRHVADREDLNASIIDTLFKDAVVHTSNSHDWRVDVEFWMRDVRQLWIENPWLGTLFNPAARISSGGFAVLNRLVQVLERAGFSPVERARGAVWIARTTVSLALLENRTPSHVGQHPDDLVLEMNDDTRLKWEPVLPEVVAYTTEEIFDFTILMAIGALEHRARLLSADTTAEPDRLPGGAYARP